jgi:hypothetical protein
LVVLVVLVVLAVLAAAVADKLQCPKPRPRKLSGRRL